MAYDVPSEDHFEGQANITKGNRKSGGPILAELFRKIRTGSVTASGAGTEAIVFSEPFDDASYTVSFSTDTLATTPEYANKAAAGMDIVVAAAGSVDYMAIHD
jgi:hypothetical protein